MLLLFHLLSSMQDYKLTNGHYESAKIDGASRFQQVWYVVIPHLMPITFVALMQLMDNFRVFEPIVALALKHMHNPFMVYFQ